jgi:hypothetical protein
MKRQSLVVLAVAFVAAAATGCFKDPTSSLQNGPAYLTLSDAATIMRTGDSIAVVATLKDSRGTALSATGARWASADPTIATARLDTTTIPANAFTRGFIVAVSPTGGWTTDTVTSRGISAVIRVTVLPAGVPASLVSRSGGPTADTVGTTVISAPDTLILTGTTTASGSLNFDPTATVTVGGVAASIIARTATKLTAVVLTGASGSIVVKKLLFVSGSTSIGTIAIDSLVGPSTTLSRARFRGAITQVGDTMTITASANQTFSATTGVKFGATAAIVLSQTATQLSVLSPVAFSGQVTVTGLTMGAAAISSLTTNAATPYSMNAATFPAANIAMSPNNARLGDTVILTAPTGLSFVTSGTVSNVILGNSAISTSDTAWVLSRSATTIKAFAKRGGSSNVTVTRLKLGSGAVIPQLSTPAAVAIDSIATDFAPATTKATARVTVIPAGNVDTVYGAVNCSLAGCQQPPNGVTTPDYWTFTTAASQIIGGSIAWYGSGNPYSGSDVAHTADLDMVLCNAAQACPISEANDLWGGKAATAAMPEAGATTTAQVAGQYWINVIPFTGPQTVVYRLIITLQ